MNQFKLGSTLLHKYRIAGFRKRTDGVMMYEGVDTSRPRRVSIKILERAAAADAATCARFHDESRGANVVDIGTCDGLPYFVTAELTPPRPSKRASSKPPPLPSTDPRSGPSQMARPKPPPLPAIPIFLDEDALVDVAPPRLPPLPPPPPISSETLLPTAFETKPRERSRASWALVLVAIASITGVGGWFVGHVQTDITPAQAAPQPMEPQATTAPVVETVTAPAASESATAPQGPAPSSRPRRPKIDPLTL